MKGDPQTFAIIGAAMEVHRELGPGFLESVYHAALAHEFRARGIPFVSETMMPISYAGVALPCTFRADFVCFGEVVVEIKTVGQLHPAHQAQLMNQLKAARYERGLLINFGASSLEHKRIIKSLPLPIDSDPPRLYEDPPISDSASIPLS